MPSKKETERSEQTFDLILDHADLVDLMNDGQVLIDGGDVADDQEFQIVLKRCNGSETVLKTMIDTDKLVIRFTKVTITTTDDEFGDVDIT